MPNACSKNYVNGELISFFLSFLLLTWFVSLLVVIMSFPSSAEIERHAQCAGLSITFVLRMRRTFPIA